MFFFFLRSFPAFYCKHHAVHIKKTNKQKTNQVKVCWSLLSVDYSDAITGNVSVKRSRADLQYSTTLFLSCSFRSPRDAVFPSGHVRCTFRRSSDVPGRLRHCWRVRWSYPEFPSAESPFFYPSIFPKTNNPENFTRTPLPLSGVMRGRNHVTASQPYRRVAEWHSG